MTAAAIPDLDRTYDKTGKSLRIVMVSQFALPKICGIAAIIDQLARKMIERGHRVTHLVSSYHQPPGKRSDLPYRLVTVPAWNPLEDRFGIPYPVFAPRRLWQCLRQELESADVFHPHGFLSQPSAPGFLFSKRRGRPVRVLTEHVGHVPYSSKIINGVESIAVNTVGRFTARLAQSLVTYNSSVERTLRDLAPGVPIVNIGNGVNLERYRPPEPGEKERLREELGWDGRPRVLFVGRLVDKKGAPIAIEAARAAGDAFVLVLVGPGEPPPPHPNVEFLGPLAQDRVAEIYRASDMFVLPSRGEGFPLSSQEAMASGLPIVLSDEPSYRSVLEGAGQAAILVEPNPEAVRAAILRSLANAREAGDEALRFARIHYSWDRAADEHLSLYEKLLEAESGFEENFA